MRDETTVQREILSLFSDELALAVPSPETDLIETGILDSMKFVELLTLLERHFGATISLEDLELENFRTLAKIADFVVRREILTDSPLEVSGGHPAEDRVT